MPKFWLDSSCLIESKNRYYGFDIVPGFWAFLEQKAKDGIIASCLLVYTELQELEDELSRWAREQKEKGFFVAPDASVQAVVSDVSQYVSNRYDMHHVAKFLAGADPWLIAHAKVDGGRIVTHETPAPTGKKPKIPDVAGVFGVETIEQWR
jgi:hypothetical protein